jgi:transcriptional regulator with XRE-family HTH domain
MVQSKTIIAPLREIALEFSNREGCTVMTVAEFEDALTALGWKGSDFCRMAGVHRNTPSRWRQGETDIPLWVDKFLGMALEIKRLHETYVIPTKDDKAEPEA